MHFVMPHRRLVFASSFTVLLFTFQTFLLALHESTHAHGHSAVSAAASNFARFELEDEVCLLCKQLDAVRALSIILVPLISTVLLTDSKKLAAPEFLFWVVPKQFSVQARGPPSARALL